MIRDPGVYWYPFNPENWLARMSTAGLSIPAQGVLWRLVCVQLMEGNIPCDLGDITRKLGGYSGEGIAEALKFFVPRQGTVGKQYWPVVESWRDEAILRHGKRVAAGRRGIEARMAKAKTRQYQEDAALIRS
jgi:hypothetical protein